MLCNNHQCYFDVALQAAYSDEGAEWLDRMNVVVHRNFLALRELFDSRFPSVRVPDMEATYLLWADFDATSGKVVADTLLEHGVRVSDGAIYGGPSGVRINLACPEATMKEGLRRIAEGLSTIVG